MATRREAIRAAAGAAAAALLTASGCRASGEPPLDDALEERAAALRARLPLATCAYWVTAVRREGAQAVVAAELRHRFEGHGSGPETTAARRLELRRDGGGAGRWRVRADRPAAGAPQQLWDQGEVRTARGARSLVLGVGQPAARLRELAADADRAVPAVSAAWPLPWARRVVVLVPASLDGMGGLLGGQPAAYRGMAAVAAGGAGTPDRLIVNPEAYGELSAYGREVVLTHEAAHVATRAETSASTPMWLSEGFADWSAYRTSSRPAPDLAPALTRAVRRGDLPATLPADASFAFGGPPETLALAYEGAWLACALIADRWGETRLRELYRAAGAGGAEPGVREVLGVKVRTLETQWRAYTQTRLSP
ncbi:hypothetical protein QCN29_08405 [Streptomyces sp. HNM0663]|uniref:DUF1570 domain-containing protein n=1 Tax=Streptomyces chengmaiensis TaxID=3040919 RepID=A0ABT6HJE1_9ACTN|nr:hypothetical protein [Streptomyces chengmaiensis]MDH2388808.1 hypothetical protein [Streptomyces chengmaiensis]